MTSRVFVRESHVRLNHWFNIREAARFGDLAAFVIKIQNFCCITHRLLVYSYRSFRGACRLHLQGLMTTNGVLSAAEIV
jgi:hypothetical protein